jgi:acetyl-CoA carboxylase carboxyl transferase subunit beta
MPQTPTTVTGRKKRAITEGTWIQCPGCKSPVVNKEVEKLLRVCPNCDYHMYVSARQRIEQVLDDGTFEEWDGNILSSDPLAFADSRPYPERIVAERKKTGLSDAAITGTGMIRARRVAIGITDSQFIMGSMGSVVGERLTRLVEGATEHKLPLIIVSGSGGGARMHEGIFR